VDRRQARARVLSRGTRARRRAPPSRAAPVWNHGFEPSRAGAPACVTVGLRDARNRIDSSKAGRQRATRARLAPGRGSRLREAAVDLGPSAAGSAALSRMRFAVSRSSSPSSSPRRRRRDRGSRTRERSPRVLEVRRAPHDARSRQRTREHPRDRTCATQRLARLVPAVPRAASTDRPRPSQPTRGLDSATQLRAEARLGS